MTGRDTVTDTRQFSTPHQPHNSVQPLPSHHSCWSATTTDACPERLVIGSCDIGPSGGARANRPQAAGRRQRGTERAARATERPGGPNTSFVNWLDGPRSPNNTSLRFTTSGADLGIMWDNGDPTNNQVLIAFGDTFGNCTVPKQDWRSNTLFRSSDRTLYDGIDVPNPD
jgi:hypothetical protein